MDECENRTRGGTGDAAEEWLRTRLTAHAADIPVLPPDIAGIDARRRGIRNRRAGWAACAVSAVTAGAVVAAVAVAGAAEREPTAAPPAASTVPAPPAATDPAATPPATGGPESTPPAAIAQPGPPTQPGTAAPSGSPTPSGTTTPSAPRSAPATAKPGGATGGGGTPGTRSEEAVAPCTAGALAVSAAKEPADSRQPRHLLITVQNAGSTRCSLYHYPHVLLGDAKAPAPVIADSDPDPGRPVVLAPGGEAYAAMVLNGPMDEYEVKHITLTLHGPARGSRTSVPMDVPMPVTTLYANDFQRVTYWTTAPGLALDFVMSR